MKKIFLIITFWFISFIIIGQNKDQVAANNRSTIIPDKYIVVFKDKVVDPQYTADEHVKNYKAKVQKVFQSALKGYAARISAEDIEQVKNDPLVQFVVSDREISLLGIDKGIKQEVPSQVIPNGIARIGVDRFNKGAGIGVAVIDTGIDLTHPDLAENIIASTSCVGTIDGNDDHGHGTHVAGTIAAADNNIGVVGVAPKANLVAVKVLERNGMGTWSSVICGIDWVTANATRYNIKVANMSLGADGASDNNCGLTDNDPLHQALCNSTKKGVTYVVAAGNNGSDAATFIPAAYNDTVITVSGLVDTDGKPGGRGSNAGDYPDDTFIGWSNYGVVVDLGAPGTNIWSTCLGGTYAGMTGTSMASPHVAGAIALYIKTHPKASFQQIRDALVKSGEKLNAGHTDPTGLHPEPVVSVNWK